MTYIDDAVRYLSEGYGITANLVNQGGHRALRFVHRGRIEIITVSNQMNWVWFVDIVSKRLGDPISVPTPTSIKEPIEMGSFTVDELLAQQSGPSEPAKPAARRHVEELAQSTSARALDTAATTAPVSISEPEPEAAPEPESEVDLNETKYPLRVSLYRLTDTGTFRLRIVLPEVLKASLLGLPLTVDLSDDASLIELRKDPHSTRPLHLRTVGTTVDHWFKRDKMDTFHSSPAFGVLGKDAVIIHCDPKTRVNPESGVVSSKKPQVEQTQPPRHQDSAHARMYKLLRVIKALGDIGCRLEKTSKGCWEFSLIAELGALEAEGEYRLVKTAQGTWEFWPTATKIIRLE